MGDLLETASAWLEGQRTKFMTRSVTYRRGTDSVDLPATIGETVFRIDDGAGALLRIQSRDYLVSVPDLMLVGSPAIPKKGDRILESQGTQTLVYEVTAPGDEPEWCYSDPYRQTYRIHTQQVDTQ